MEDWEVCNSEESRELKISEIKDLKVLIKECHEMLIDTKKQQQEIIKMIDSLNNEPEIKISNDFTSTIRESNRAWRLYGNHYKPIIPIIGSNIFGQLNTTFLNNFNQNIYHKLDKTNKTNEKNCHYLSEEEVEEKGEVDDIDEVK